MSEDTTGSGLGGVSGGGLEGGATGAGGAGGASSAPAGGGATASGALAAGLGGLAGRLPNGGASLLNRLAEGSPLPVHDHLTPSTGGTIDYLRTQWGTDHLAAADPHPQYLTPAEGDALFLTPAEGDSRYAPIGSGGGTTDVTITTDASLTATESPANTFALATRRSATAGNSLALNADGLFVPDFLTQAEGDARYPLAGATDPYPQYATDADLAAHAAAADPHPVYLSQTEGDARYPLAGAADPYPQYLTQTEGDGRYLPLSYTPPPADVTVTTDASLTATESPANTFALAVRLSPDAGNALALRGNGLFATDTTGGGGGGLATDALADARGDVFAASGPDAVGRLPVGANGLVLTADSAQTLGVGWAVPATQSHAHGGSAGDGGVIAYLPLTGGTLTGALTLQGAAAATNVLQAKLAADTQPRFRADASGRLEWGPGGSTAPAAALYRNGTGALETTASVLPDATNTRSLGSAATAWSSVWGLLLQTPNTGSLVLGVSLPASAGAIRLRNAANGQIAWRNAGNTADVTLGVDASDRFAFTSDLLVSEATPTVALQQAADTQPRARLSDTALAFGPGGTTAPDTTLQRTGAQQAGLNATLTVTPAAGQPALAWSATGSLGASGSQAVVNSGAALLFGATGFAGPVADNSIACGWSDKRWTQILAVAGTINTSLAEAKQDITPLDPAAALAAVLHTDPVVFDYKAPERTAEWYELPDDPEQAEAVLYQRLTGAPLEAAARHQAGFVLQDATGTYHTDPAFETGSGQSSPQNSVGVLIGAIHALAARVAALEGA